MSSNKVIDKDRGWAAYFAQMRQMKSAYVKVGVLADGKGAEKEPGSDLTVAEIAAVHEFGTEDGHIPERSFVRSTFDEQRPALKQVAENLAQQILFGKATVEQAMNMLGALLAGEMKRKIQKGINPPNAPSTLLAKAMKGRTAKFFKRPARTIGEAFAQVGALASVKPLIDTGRLLNSITWAVELGEK